MCRRSKQLLYRCFLDDLTGVHDDHTVRHARYQPDVMGDQDHRHPTLFLQIAQQRHNLCLNRHIQCRRRFICDQQARIAAQSHRDHHTLAHAAGKRMGIFFHDTVRIGHTNFS